jgi:hypothetical protein
VACALVVVGLGALFIITATNYRDLQDTTNHLAGHDGTVHHKLRAGTDYWVYQDTADAKPTRGVTCEVVIGSRRWTEPLATKLPTTANEEETEGTTNYRFIGGFTAPATGEATVTCAALSTGWFLVRDSTGLAVWAFACCAGCFIPILGLLIIVFVAWRRRRAAERAAHNPWGQH